MIKNQHQLFCNIKIYNKYWALYLIINWNLVDVLSNIKTKQTKSELSSHSAIALFLVWFYLVQNTSTFIIPGKQSQITGHVTTRKITGQSRKFQPSGNPTSILPFSHHKMTGVTRIIAIYFSCTLNSVFSVNISIPPT